MLFQSILGFSTLFSTLVALPPNERIVGGVEVNPKFKYNWIVSIQVNGRHYCGGNIINKDTILTAAHCSTRSASSYTVNIHRHDLTTTSEAESGETIKVSKITTHPNYDSSTTSNDVSVWKLATPISVEFTAIDLDDGTYGSQAGLNVIASGWGVTKAGGAASPVLREVTIPLVDNETCIKSWSPYGVTINPEVHICAAGQGGKDACNGDSGGPLFYVKSNGVPTLIGTTSFGRPCAYKNFPTIWARTSTFVDFINQNS